MKLVIWLQHKLDAQGSLGMKPQKQHDIDNLKLILKRSKTCNLLLTFHRNPAWPPLNNNLGSYKFTVNSLHNFNKKPYVAEQLQECSILLAYLEEYI